MSTKPSVIVSPHKLAAPVAATGDNIAAGTSEKYTWPNATNPGRLDRMTRVFITNRASAPGPLLVDINNDAVSPTSAVFEIQPGQTLALPLDGGEWVIESVAIHSASGHTYQGDFYVNGVP